MGARRKGECDGERGREREREGPVRGREERRGVMWVSQEGRV